VSAGLSGDGWRPLLPRDRNVPCRTAILGAVEVKDEDIDLVAEATGLPRKAAETRLREASGDAALAIARVAGIVLKR
jgi:hypothetical protein